MSGGVGEIHDYLGTFTFDGVSEGNYRLSQARGGGALYDVGIYPLHTLVACLPDVASFDVAEVEVVVGGDVDDPVDLTTKAALTWGPDTRASIVGSFTMPESQRLAIRGSDASVRVDDDQAFTSWREPSRLLVGEHVETFPAVDAYRLMVEQVSLRIRGGEGWVLPASDSLRVARAVDAIRATSAGLRNT